MAEKKDNDGRDMFRIVNAASSVELTQRYGSAIKEHLVSYSGVDNETGKRLAKGLKQIGAEKVNPDSAFSNTRQQAGFAAEVKEVARTNADNIIKRDKKRKIRTDDLGRVNDPLIDTVMLDANGNIIEGSGAQIKFLGASASDPSGAGDAARALSKLQSKKCDKYLEADCKIVVPSDQYDEMLAEADRRLAKYHKQLERQQAAGNTEQVKAIQARIERLEKIKKNLRKSKVSQKAAEFAKKHPKLSTAADVVRVAHRSGVEAAEMGSVVGGSISLVKNLVSVYKGEEKPGEAVKAVAKDTAVAACSAYAHEFGASALNGAMQNSSKKVLQNVAKAGGGSYIVTAAASVGKAMYRYFSGEIDGVQCMEQMGEDGYGMVAAAVCGAVGQAVIPFPVIGAVVGSMVGYMMSSASYGILTTALKDEKLAKNERAMVQAACREHIRLLRQYKAETEALVAQYLVGAMAWFRDSFEGVLYALEIGDADMLIQNANAITESMGKTPLFSDSRDFERKMEQQEPFEI